MKQVSAIISGIVLMLVLSVQSVGAQTTTASTTQAPESSATTSVTQSTAPASQNTPASPRPLPAAVQTRIVNLAANMSNRADALINRFELIIVRMESRMTKMESGGYDTVDSRFYVSEAKKSLEKAKTEMTRIDAKIAAFVTAQNYWAGWFAIRDSFSEIKSQLTTTKQLLNEAISDMEMTALGEPTVQQNASTSNPMSTN